MSLEWVRRQYGVPAKRGTRVEVPGANGGRDTGTVTSANHHLRVRLDGGPKRPYPYHPRYEVVYFAPDGSIALDTRKGPEKGREVQ